MKNAVFISTEHRTVKQRLGYALNLLDEVQGLGDKDNQLLEEIEEIIASCMDDLEDVEIIRKSDLLECERE